MTINFDDYIAETTALKRGETVSVNHAHCSAGTDRKRRLYLTRPATNAGVVLGYCHNCQDSGVLNDANETYRDFATPPAITAPNTSSFGVPKNLITRPSRWPDVALSWRIKKRLSEQQCLALGIAYDPASHRIYLPIWKYYDHSMGLSDKDVLIGYQLRHLEGAGPKYYTSLRDKTVTAYSELYADRRNAVTVLVEDLASGIAILYAAVEHRIPCTALVNYGVKVTPEVLAAIEGMEEAIVWLDNDDDHVVEQAETIARVWKMISGSDVRVHKGTKEPKELSSDKIAEIIWHG